MKLFVTKLMNKREVDGDGIMLVTDEGITFELWQRGDGEVRLSCNGTMLIEPRAGNLVTLRRDRP